MILITYIWKDKHQQTMHKLHDRYAVDDDVRYDY